MARIPVPLREWLVHGDVDTVRNEPTSWFSNRLVLRDFDVIDHTKLDTEDKIKALPVTVSLRGRNFRGAILDRAGLRKVDLTGADLQGASMGGAQLQGASMDGAKLQGASMLVAQLQGASMFHAHLQGVLMDGAQLQGALMDDAQLQGASMDGAQLQGASMLVAQLQGTSMFGAQLHGAWMFGAQLQGAAMVGAQLQGASIYGARLQGASLVEAAVWRADAEHIMGDPVELDRLQVANIAHVPDMTRPTTAWSTQDYDNLRATILREVPTGRLLDDALRRIEIVNPERSLLDEAVRRASWVHLWAAAPSPNLFAEARSVEWQKVGCQPDGAPHVLAGLIRNFMRYQYHLFGRLQYSISLTSDTIRQLAKAFLAPDCLGAVGLSKEDRATLVKLSRP